VLLFQLNRQHGALAESWQQNYAALGARIAELESRAAHSLSVGQPKPDDPSAACSPGSSDSAAPDLTELLARLDNLETRIAQLADGQDGSKMPSATSQREMLAKRAEALEEQIRSRPSTDVVAERHAKESGTSDWGAATTERVNWAYADAPFFAEHGGRLSLDCRQSSCRAHWQAPDLSGLDPLEAEQQLALAGYELLAVISKGGPEIGPIHTVSTMEEGKGQEINVYFSREPSE
jgi:hypothetical protein